MTRTRVRVCVIHRKLQSLESLIRSEHVFDLGFSSSLVTSRKELE
jgi:hypothetical protein